MRQWNRMLVGALMVAAAGCRAATRVVDAPRVDLQMTEGNRGFVVGRPTQEPRLKRTRQIVETDVELDSTARPSQQDAAVVAPIETTTPPVVSETVVVPEPQSAAPVSAQHYDRYVVKKGDTLWTIAANPNVYGDASRWRKIYDANRDAMKNTKDLHVGMTLQIPREGMATQASSVEEPAAAYSK